MKMATFTHVSEKQWQLDAPMNAMSLESIPLPHRATAGSAGHDFVCPVTVTLIPGQRMIIPSGVRCEMEEGWVLLLFPRSSMGIKHGLQLGNTTGVIDADYAHADNEGHILISLVNTGDHTFTLNAGDRFVQGVFVPFGSADDAEGRRAGGLGSTGV